MTSNISENIQNNQSLELKSNTTALSVHDKVAPNNEGALMLTESEAYEQMESCLDSEDPILMQSQTSDMIVEEISNKGLIEDVQERAMLVVQTQSKQAPMPPIQAQRMSSRDVGSGTPMMEKAEKLKAYKNLQGTSHNPFTILQNVDNVQLAKVVVACNLVLVVDECKIDEFIYTVKAKEIAQADITSLEKAKESENEVVVVEEINDSDDECPVGHCLIVEELIRIDLSSQLIPLPVFVEETNNSIDDCPDV